MSNTDQQLVDRTVALLQSTFPRPSGSDQAIGSDHAGWSDPPSVVLSPYRMNPLGAHIDHQGGSVLARTIDQYSVVAFYPREDSLVRLHCDLPGIIHPTIEFSIGDAMNRAPDDAVWATYAMGSAAVASEDMGVQKGMDAVVTGTLSSSGLSSSASVILAYLHAFASAGKCSRDKAQFVEMARRVENDFVGLASGIQDQMSIVFGERESLSLLHMNTVTADQLPNPPNYDELCWILCYSGFSRELISSGFNTRVSECCEAAAILAPGATHLGEVPVDSRKNIEAQLPAHLQRRVQHVYGEMDRVLSGALAWRQGDAKGFGELMNASCKSSIELYECGTDPMIDLHSMATETKGVYGSRFGGGGYGGCLIILGQSSAQESICTSMQEKYLAKYPDKRGIARFFVARAESHVRLLPSTLLSDG